MARFRDLLLSWRLNRIHRLKKTDSVSFEAFCNELPPVRFSTTVKESSLSDEGKSPPKPKEAEDYVRFSTGNLQPSASSRPGFASYFFIIFALTVFFIFPTMYLLQMYGVINIREAIVALHYSKDGGNPSRNRNRDSIVPAPDPDYNKCRLLNDSEKLDCMPEYDASEYMCEHRGCCWIPLQNDSASELGVPYCFYPPDYYSYNYVNISETAYGLTAYLKQKLESPYSQDIRFLKMTVKYETEERLRIKITDPAKCRYEPPYPEVPIVDKASGNLSYVLELNKEKMGFRILRKSDNTIVFDSFTFGNFIFSNQFLQLSGKLPSTNIYGLGEHTSNLMLSTQWKRFTMFNHDGIPSENLNLYGTHPFYLVMEESGNSHGVFLLNSNAMDIILQPAPIITFRTIGGVLDFYFFLGPSPSEVVSQYTEVIGRPYMPPYWSLGFHLCRFGYVTLENTRKVLQRNLDAGIPIDTQWNDLDYMDNSNDFTYDKKNFKGLPDFVKELHSKGMHYIPLIDPGVSASEPAGSYPPYDKGIEMDIFVKDFNGNPFVGKVWNRATTVWPDFTNPHSVDYWILMLKSLHNDFEFDGAWIDMNEPSNFLSGSFDGCRKNNLEDPPYLPNVDGRQLFYKTLCMSAKHFAGLHYDVHNLYGLTEAIVTNFALAEIRGKRPVVISRSTFPGLGHYAGHWSGDVYSKFEDMKYSIPQMLSFSMFGVPLMGADICGFNGNTTVVLCARWMQLGAFYPFSRNHNTDDGIDQDPVALGPLVVESAKKALAVRYSLLPYLYTLFWAAHARGETVARPVFFEFTNDKNTYAIDEQFMWGPAIMITPVLEENAVEVFPYLPAGIWYDFYTKLGLESKGSVFNISAPMDVIPVFVRGGYVVAQQSALPTTTQSRLSKMQILAASDADQKGFGELYWDDGDSLNSLEERKYSLVQFALNPGELTSKPVWWGFGNLPPLGVITILGVNVPVNEVTVNNQTRSFHYNSTHKYLLVDNLSVTLQNPITVNWK